MKRLAAILALAAALSVACAGLVTPGLPAPRASTPDIEATVQAAVRTALPAPASQVTPEIQATIAAGVQATIEALRSPVPADTPAPSAPPEAISPEATAAAPVLGSTVPAASAAADVPVPNPTAVPAVVPSPQPTPAMAPTPTPTPLPIPILVPTATIEPEPTAPPTPTPVPTPAPTATATPAPAGGCGPSPDGTVVSAWIEGVQVASTTVADGAYVLFISQGEGESFSGKTVTFKLGALDAEGSGTWAPGGADELDLTAAPLGQPGPTPAPLGRFSRSPAPLGLLAQPVPPHLFLGSASVCS